MTAILTDRFWSKVDKTASDCWIWTGAIQSSGYGCWAVNRRSQLAHRVSYAALVGDIPAGLTIDHLCREKRCVNPAHLEPVTGAENNRRANAAITHCPQNHEYTPQNTRINMYGTRSCRECALVAQRARYRAARAAA